MHRRRQIPLEPASDEVRPREGRRRRFPSAALLTVLAFAASGVGAQETRGAPDAPNYYTYRDGDRTLKVALQEELVLTRTKVEAVDSSEVLASVGDAFIVRLQPEEDAPNAVSAASSALAARPPDAQPVFRSEGGTLMALPGGVIVQLDQAELRADAFFVANGIALDRVEALDWLAGGFFVKTQPGFPSLNLANELAAQAGVKISSPNWWRETTTR